MEAGFVLLFFFIISGTVLALHLYLRSRERRMMIERGMNSDEIIALYKKPKVQTDWFYRIGIVAVIFGVFLGIALYIESIIFNDNVIGPFVIVGLGIGFIVAHKLTEGKGADNSVSTNDKYGG